MTRNENQMYSDITSIRKSLKKIANALDNNVTQTTKDIPGFEGTLDALDNLYQPTSSNPDPAGYGKAMQDIYDNSTEDERCDCGNELEDKDVICESCEDETYHEYTYETDLQGIRKDDDHDIRVAASCFEEDYATKKDAILDYVTNEFGILGARYTDIIKFAYYLGSPNAPKYTSANRGYYACAFNTNGFGGHLVQGGKNQLVKGINKEGNERYFAFSFVESATDYWKYVDDRSAR